MKAKTTALKKPHYLLEINVQNWSNRIIKKQNVNLNSLY
jgi:hypothetical protein